MSELEEFPREPYPRGGPGCGHLALHPDGRTMITGHRGDFQVRAPPDGRILRAMQVRAPTSMSLSPDGRTLLVGDKDNSVKLFDLASGALISESNDFDDWVEQVGWLDDSERFVAMSRKSRMVVGQRRDAVTVFSDVVNEQDHWVNGLAVVRGRGHCVIASSYELYSIDLRDGRRRWEIPFNKESRAKALSVSRDGWRGVVHVQTATEEGLQFFLADDGAFGPRYVFKTPGGVTWPEMKPMFIRWDSEPVFAPNGRIVAANTPVGTLVIVDADTGAPLWEAPRERGMAWIQSLAWFDDSNHLLVGCADNGVAIWRMQPLAYVFGFPMK